ncbi:diguanylate cyclase domain-containing protein [Stutzerimonas stutzeri]|uniref:TackOD1 domain-containing metal-binding protein n=1 Tax=Stutzerimonas stutzeri TaxID=316 RepID=UPI00210E39C7|nr:diguanylate cyclase [Stutzerimonas stutzeri]MCQ4241301.1 diguanylate cyclase [Stutzerimonas stutzeri]
MSSSPRIAVLGVSQASYSSIEVERLAALSDLRDAPAYDVLLLDLPGARAGEALRALRMDRRYRFSLIYCCQDQDACCVALGDGAPPSDLGALASLWQLWNERFGLFNRGALPERFEARVLAWLWLRPQSAVYAVRSVSVAQHYHYPLLEALGDDETPNAFTWLQLMTQQGWLEEAELLDRVRLCVGCGSGRLNYVDVCPECQTLEIARQPSLHCFTCGHVGPQEHFLKDGLLLCPNCLSRLRHIGSDYDRPLENYRCRSCQSFFVDADIEARCLDCGLAHAPDKLRVREVRNYRLAEAGRLRCRQGYGSNAVEANQFSQLNLLTRKAFHELLNWQLQQVRRYKQPAFSLLGLRFVNLAATISELGELRGHALVDGLVEHLQEAVRDTDRCSRVSEEILWIMMPHTDASGVAVVRQRLAHNVERLASEHIGRLQLRQASFTAPDDLLEQEDAALLLARLGGELG